MTAAVYFDQADLWGHRAEPYQVQVRADILDLLPGDVHSVLDVGCGDGAITNALPAHLRVVGVDASAAALRHLRVEGRVGSITQLPCADGSFDLVLATDVLEHLPPEALDQAVRELTRVARKYVLVCVPNREDWPTNRTRCAGCGSAYHVNHHQKSWTEDDLVRGLLPEPWHALEIRYSGLFRPPHDPTIDLRHKLDLWNTWDGAVCSTCQSKEQIVAEPRLRRAARYLDGLCGNQWWAGGVPPARFADRSEVMALFACGPRPPRLHRPSAPAVALDSPLSLDFRNGLQRVDGWTAGPRWASWLAGPEQVRCAQGVRLLRREFFTNELALRFPVQPCPGDELLLELTTSDRELVVNLFAWDALAEQRVPLATRTLGPGPHRLALALPEAIRDSSADRFGFLFVVSIRGSALVRRADYRPTGPRCGATIPWLYLAPGHQALTQPTADFDRSWGITTLEGGRLPLPVELTEATADALAPEATDLAGSLRATPTRAGRKRADNLFFLMQQELTGSVARPPTKDADKPTPAPEEAAPAPASVVRLVEEYHKVLSHRGRRVLVLSHLYPSPELPGLGPFVHEQVSALRINSGVDARVVCCTPFWCSTFHPAKIARVYQLYRARLRELRWQQHDGVPVLYLPYLVGGLFRRWLHADTYRNAVLAAADWLRARFDFEVIHAHTSFLDGTAALALSRRFNVPYLLTEHTGPFRQLTDHPLMRARTVRALTGARQVYCVSGALADDVRAALPAAQHGKIDVLANGVDTAQFYLPPQRAADPARPRLLSVISLDANKNPLLLLDAFKQLLADVPGATLTIAGDGELRGAVEAKVNAEGLGRAVTLLGFRPRAEIARLMREACDVFVLPSNSETFGVVLIEALACGKPIVSTDCGGPRDVVTDPSLGRLCPPRDAAALAAALRDVACDLGAFRAEAIRRHAVERFDYFSLAARLAEVYDDVV